MRNLLFLGHILYLPGIFPIFIIGLSILSIAVVFVYIRNYNKQKKTILIREEESRRSWEVKIKQQKEENLALRDALENLKDAAQRQTQESRLVIEELKNNLNKKDEALRAQKSEKDILASDFEAARNNLASVKNELELKIEEFSIVDRLSRDLLAKEDELRENIVNSRQLKASLKIIEDQFESLRSSGIQKDQELLQSKKDAQELRLKDEEIKARGLEINKLCEELSGIKEQLKEVERRFNFHLRVYNDLKAEYGLLEQQNDVLKQSLALERSMHEQIRQEHNRRAK